MILADSDVLIDYLLGVSPAREQVTHLIESGMLQTTTVNCFEILQGAGEGREGDAARRLVKTIPSLPLDRQAAERAAAVSRHLKRSGQSIGMGDSLIAGIALANNLPLLTRNRDHFIRVPRLTLVKVQNI
jgi:tRNA(fMet)-specific endonuclease VapC